MTESITDIQTVVFDCDGVMFDTEKANRIYYNRILEHFGKPPLTQEQFEFAHMSTVNEALAHLFSDSDNLDEVYDYCRTITYDPLIPHMEMEPNLKPLLNKLRKRFSTAIATNRSTTMNNVIEHHGLSELFDLIVTSLDVEHPKPDPEQLYKIMDTFNVSPNEIIYIGDSETDEKAALSSGVLFIAYKNTSLQADYHISSLSEVETILNI